MVPIYVYSRPVYRNLIWKFQTQVSHFDYFNCIFTNLRLALSLVSGTVSRLHRLNIKPGRQTMNPRKLVLNKMV